jgi:AcrR family transcriptional regulator
MSPLTETLARRAVERTVADRQAEYAQEMRRIVEATYGLIERTGSLDPSLRDILADTGLSTQAFYRLFRSKDELLLVLLDDGRRRLVDYLAGRMAAVDLPTDKVRAWIEGVLAQASTPKSAERTRPFLANEDRLSELFPMEQRESVDLLVDLLVQPLTDATPVDGPPDAPPDAPRRDAEAIYRLVFGLLHAHLIQRTRPTAETIGHTVRFCMLGAGLDGGGLDVARSSR